MVTTIFSRVFTTTFLALMLLLLAGTVAWADSAADEADRNSLVRELSDRFDITVEEPARWEVVDLHSVLRGAEALPTAAWRILEGPLVMEYRAQPCLFAMGRYNERCPTFGESRTHFYIYDSPPIQGEGPVETLSILTGEEQRDLQVRRAVIHMAMVQLDRNMGWSSTAEWRSINSWPKRRGTALNMDPWGYSRYLGMHSAHLDLVTFSEEYFVRPEDLLIERARQDPYVQARLDELDPDMTVACQQFTKRRILGDRLQEIDSRWEEPVRALPHIEDGQPECPAFVEWARPDHLDGFDLFLAAATANQPESLYGHLLLHVRYKSDGRVRGEGFEPVYQFGAVTDTDVSRLDYFVRGFLGGFPSILELNTFRGVDRLFLQYQQRSLRRYSLQLTDEQGLHFLERIWEGERRIRYPYVFLPHNCASFLVDLLAPAVDASLAEAQSRIVMPTDVLDTLADRNNGELGPLLVKRPDTLQSNREIAEDAVLKRRAILRSLLIDIEDATTASALSKLLEDLDANDPEHRQGAYEQAAQIFDALLSAQPELNQRSIDLLYQSVLVERYFMELAHFARRAVYASGAQGEPQTIDEHLARRRELYRNEDLEARIAAYNKLTGEAESLVATGSDREFTAREERILEYETITRGTYLTVLQVQSGLIDRHLPEWNGVAYLDEQSQAYYDRMKQLDERSQGPSGRNRLSLGAGWEPSTQTPTLELSFSMVEDRLGELRRRGYSGGLESRILSVDAVIPFDPDGLQNTQMDLVLFRYRTVDPTYGPLKDSIFDNMGWSVDLRVTHDGRRDLWASLAVTPTLLIPLWTTHQNIHHLVVEAGGALRYDVHGEQTTYAGAFAGIFGQLHLYGSYANVARFGVESGQYLTFGPQWRFDARAHASTRHALFSIGQRPLIIEPFVEALWTTRDYRSDAAEEGFQTWRGGLKMELPF